MKHVIEGHLVAAPGDRFAIVVSRFNESITERLLQGAIDTLRRHGVSEDHVQVARVPGSFELPVVAAAFARSGEYAAVICLGAVIQGETTHHEYINSSMASGLMSIGVETGVPVSFGVLTCQSTDQAIERSGGKAGNKGVEAALAALETVGVLRQLRKQN
jgi:6,7-dimethyl-8-ribityllumazine synthase